MSRKTRSRKTAPAREEPGSRLDRVGFGLFAAGVVLAFTTDGLDQFVLPKLLVLDIYVLFISVRWAVAAGRGRVRSLPRILAVPTAAWAAWGIVTTLTAQQPATALFGMRARYNGLATMLAELAVFLVLATSVATRREVERRLAMLGAALAAAATYALLQAAGLDPISWPPGRPASTMAHPVVFGGALALFLPVAAAFAVGGRSGRVRRAWAAIAIVQALALELTLARGPWLATLAGLGVFAALALPQQPILRRRFARLSVAGALAAAAVLALSAPTRDAVLGRAATLASLSRDSSLAYRMHFARAGLAMLRDHPVIGVGWENFGLLYPAYREAPTASVAADLVPTMVHSGPLQVAVSGGVAALVLGIAFLAALVVVVARRRRADPSTEARLLSAAFLGSIAAFCVQDLSGWPHVALDTVAFAVWGLAAAWALEARAAIARPVPARWALAAVTAAGAAALILDTGRRLEADRRIFEAQRLDVRTDWVAVQEDVRAAIDRSPDGAWANDAAAQIYVRRVAATGDRDAYDRAIGFVRTARAANPLDPYARLRRTELDLVAIDRGLIGRVSEEGEAALATARTMTKGSVRVGQVEASLDRKAGGSRVVWIEPSASAGVGPPESLVVGGVAPHALPGSHVFLHWRDAARGSAWTIEPYAPVPNPDGAWIIAIPGASAQGTYEVYATSETWSDGPCTYPGLGKIQLCAPLALIAPHPVGGGSGRALMFAGLVPADPKSAALGFRDAARRSDWVRDAFTPGAAAAPAIVFPEDTPGHWYRLVPEADLSDAYEAFVSTAKERFGPCAYPGDGRMKLCSPIAWIQPQASAGFGPPGSLVVAGALPEARSGAPVFLHWRNLTRHSGWATEAAAPLSDATGSWSNFIPNADPSDRYQIWISSPTTASPTCTYAADGGPHLCR